jgi:hypothetical protein
MNQITSPNPIRRPLSAVQDGLVHEKADPFPRQMPVILRSARYLAYSIGLSDQCGSSEFGNDILSARPNFITFFKFHAAKRSEAGRTNTVLVKIFGNGPLKD